MTPTAQAYDDGLYFSFGVGLAHETGERGVALQSPTGCSGADFLWSETVANGKPCIYVPSPDGTYTPDQLAAHRKARLEEIVRADGGSMLGLQLRLGYNILGHASIETTLSGAGNVDPLEGSAHVGFQARWHPAEIWIPHDDRSWDVSTFGGVGYSLAGYVPQFDAAVHGGDIQKEGDGEPTFEGKGWLGMHASFGFGFDYKFSESASVGLDLKFIRTLYSTWVANFTDAYETEPVETPESWIIAPTLRVTWHMWSPGS